jgi:GxxExxY protein
MDDSMDFLREPSGMYESGSHKYSMLTAQIIKVYFEVYSALGYGFLEKVYENAMALRLSKSGLQVRQQQPISVHFDGQVVGEYFADLVINDLIILELKANETLAEEHAARLINHLRATRYEVGLLLNFGPKPKIIRKAYDNERKPLLAK